MSKRSRTFSGRIVGALRLDPDAFEDVEHDERAIGQALIVMLLSSVATGIGAIGPGAVATLLPGTAIAVAAWLVWSALVFVIGAKLLPEPQTEASVGQLLRTTGFAAAPGIFGFAWLVPAAGPVLIVVVTLWMLAAMLVAVRQALDFTSLWRTLGVVAIGWVAYITLLVLAASLARS